MARKEKIQEGSSLTLKRLSLHCLTSYTKIPSFCNTISHIKTCPAQRNAPVWAFVGWSYCHLEGILLVSPLVCQDSYH